MYHPNTLVDGIANFTSQRDLKLLAFSLLKSVSSMMSCEKLDIISMNKKGGITSHISFDKNNNIVNEITVLINDNLKNTLVHVNKSSLEEYTLKTEFGYLLVRSLYHDRKSKQFLVINLQTEIEKVQSDILSGILSIYNNFITLLEDSQTDELTGLANRKTFDSAISSVFDDHSQLYADVQNERRTPNKKTAINTNTFWLAIIDIDNFKLVNDEFGHLYGDEILIHLSQIIRASFRDEDLQFRFGGEEFVILLSAINQMKCTQILERFRHNVEKYNFPIVDKVTVSVGVVEFKRGTFHVTSIDYADQALYKSKKSGKNQITFFEDMLTQGTAKKTEFEAGDLDLF
jgi:diguanylate cyclase (GGDEF)-like protein